MQQINLYLPEFRPKRELISARNCVVFVVLAFVILFFWYNSTASELQVLSDKVIELEKQNEGFTKKLELLKKTPLGADRKRQEAKIKRTREAIENRNQISEIMKGRSLGNENGFSKYMNALSAYSLKGLFLQEFTLSSGGRFTRLKGVSKKPELVPLYISRLQQESIFSETKFGHLSIKNMDQYVEFLLGGDESIEGVK